MASPKARIGVAAALFVGWILYLVYLVAGTRDPIIVSRPQILAADVCILAKVAANGSRPSPRVQVTDVFGSADDVKALADQSLTLDDLFDLDASSGWTGADAYILPLRRKREDNGVSYELAAIPAMPGFRPSHVAVDLVLAGPKRAEVAAYLQEALSIGAKQADAMTLGPATLKRFVSPEVGNKMHDDLTNLGARVQLIGSETRIYRATEDALRQLRELKR